jgi:hypothetical protein
MFRQELLQSGAIKDFEPVLPQMPRQRLPDILKRRLLAALVIDRKDGDIGPLFFGGVAGCGMYRARQGGEQEDPCSKNKRRSSI